MPEPLTTMYGMTAGLIGLAVGLGVFVVPALFYSAVRMQ